MASTDSQPINVAMADALRGLMGAHVAGTAVAGLAIVAFTFGLRELDIGTLTGALTACVIAVVAMTLGVEALKNWVIKLDPIQAVRLTDLRDVRLWLAWADSLAHVIELWLRALAPQPPPGAFDATQRCLVASCVVRQGPDATCAPTFVLTAKIAGRLSRDLLPPPIAAAV